MSWQFTSASTIQKPQLSFQSHHLFIMDAEEVLKLFDSCWFGHQNLKEHTSSSTIPTSLHENSSDHNQIKEPSEPTLLRIQSGHSRSMNPFSSSNSRSDKLLLDLFFLLSLFLGNNTSWCCTCAASESVTSFPERIVWSFGEKTESGERESSLKHVMELNWSLMDLLWLLWMRKSIGSSLIWWSEEFSWGLGVGELVVCSFKFWCPNQHES